jgi:hypothetical protein
VLRLGEQMAFTNVHGYVSDELYDELHEHFDEFQVMELAVTAAALVGMAKLIFAFDYAEREDVCPVRRGT